jgi:hypothetical protein
MIKIIDVKHSDFKPLSLLKLVLDLNVLNELRIQVVHDDLCAAHLCPRLVLMLCLVEDTHGI